MDIVHGEVGAVWPGDHPRHHDAVPPRPDRVADRQRVALDPVESVRRQHGEPLGPPPHGRRVRVVLPPPRNAPSEQPTEAPRLRAPHLLQADDIGVERAEVGGDGSDVGLLGPEQVPRRDDPGGAHGPSVCRVGYRRPA